MSNPDQPLTVRLVGLRSGVDASAFIDVLKDTLVALGEINKQISPHGVANVEWEIVSAGMSSPLFAALAPRATHDPVEMYGHESIDVFVSGIEQLQTSGRCPRQFNETVLKAVSSVMRATAKGIAQVEFASKGHKATTSQAMAKNASSAIQRLQNDASKRSGEVVEYGIIEGHLKELSQLADKDRMVIVDDLTDQAVFCYFRRAELEQAGREAWKHRVSVFGAITIDRLTGNPKSVLVEQLTLLPSQEKLPQIDDLNGIDITGGMESSEYVRGLRDAE